ncbi:hypothetical protein HDU67_003013 [Dinochytrium kinnereticum]|nr:hypothetical protein HDU67_003013 [Dinochytrium kinnereticum]
MQTPRTITHAFEEQLSLAYESLEGDDLTIAVEMILEEVGDLSRERRRIARDKEVALAVEGVVEFEMTQEEEEEEDEDGLREKDVPKVSVLERCGICFERVVALDFSDAIHAPKNATTPPSSSMTRTATGIRLNPCNHEYCHTCFTTYLHQSISNPHARFPLECAEPLCATVIDVSHCSEAAGKLFDDLLMRHLEGMGRICRCPRRGCSGIVPMDEGVMEVVGEREGNAWKGVGRCLSCVVEVCGKCKEERHAPLTCEQVLRELMMEGGSGGGGGRLSEDVACVVLATGRGWKRCPRCRFFVEKVAGCNNVMCRCGVNFDYGRVG